MQAYIVSRNQTKPECHHCPTEWHQRKALTRIPVWPHSTGQDMGTQFRIFCQLIVAWPLRENQTATTRRMAFISTHGVATYSEAAECTCIYKEIWYWIKEA